MKVLGRLEGEDAKEVWRAARKHFSKADRPLDTIWERDVSGFPIPVARVAVREMAEEFRAEDARKNSRGGGKVTEQGLALICGEGKGGLKEFVEEVCKDIDGCNRVEVQAGVVKAFFEDLKPSQ